MSPQIREIYKAIHVKGPKGEADTSALIDTGATITLLEKGVVDQVGLKDEAPGDLCGILSCASVRSGIVSVKLPNCREDTEVVAFESDMNLVGMDPLADIGATINTATGEVSCPVGYSYKPSRHVHR